MKKNIEKFLIVHQQPYKDIKLWFLLMLAISAYQMCDIVITLVRAILDQNQFIYVYRIILQIANLIIFQTILAKLKDSKSGYINIVTLLKYLTLILILQETSLGFEWVIPCESLMLLIPFIVSLESNICQTAAILFNCCYTLLRWNNFDSEQYIVASIKFIILTILIQIVILYQKFGNQQRRSSKQHPSTIQVGMISMENITSPNGSQRQFIPRNNLQLFGHNLQNAIQDQIVNFQTDAENTNQDFYFEHIINSFDCGVYILEGLYDTIKIVNSFMSHIVINEEKLNQEYFNSQLYNMDMLSETQQVIIHPSFNQSKDINQFVQFIQIADTSSFIFPSTSSSKLTQIQIFLRELTLKQLLQHYLAFLHIKLMKSSNLLDFSLKAYVKQDNFISSIVIAPFLWRSKTFVILFVQDLSDSPLIKCLADSSKNIDELISDMSQKIKQPLNCTISMLEIAIKTVPQNIQEQYLHPALAGCKLLISQANDILDYVSLKNKKGKIEVQLLDVFLKDFIFDSISIIKYQAQFKGLNVAVIIKANVPKFIKTDPNRLRQILTNLLTSIIQSTVKGKIEIIINNAIELKDHIQICLRVIAQETNSAVLKTIENTYRHFKLHQQLQDLRALGKQFVQSIFIAFYLSNNLSDSSIEYNYQRIDNNECMSFIVWVKNANPNFQNQLTQKRQSAILQHSLSSRKAMFSTLKKYRTSGKLSIAPKFMPSKAQQFSKDQIEFNEKEYQNSIISSQPSSSSQSGSDDFEQEDFIPVIKEPIITESIEFQQQQQQQNQEHLEQRESLLTFGNNKSSIYNSIRYSSSVLPNDLIDCFEKMDKMKKNKQLTVSQCDVIQFFIQNLQCPQIMIHETNDLDLFALSYQLENIGLLYEYTHTRENVLSKLYDQFNQNKTCCRGFQMIIISIEKDDEELDKFCSQVKEMNIALKKDVRLIGLINYNDENYRAKIKSLPIHDFLSKPIMIDALLFILAKWIKN